MDVAGHDADLALLGCDDARAVRADEANAGLGLERFLDAHHVHDRDALGDAHDEFHARVGGFEDAVGGPGRRHEDHGGVAAGLLPRLGHRVEDGDRPVEGLAAPARGDAGDDVGAIVAAAARVERARLTGDALHEQASVFVNEDGHGV